MEMEMKNEKSVDISEYLLIKIFVSFFVYSIFVFLFFFLSFWFALLWPLPSNAGRSRQLSIRYPNKCEKKFYFDYIV